MMSSPIQLFVILQLALLLLLLRRSTAFGSACRIEHKICTRRVSRLYVSASTTNPEQNRKLNESNQPKQELSDLLELLEDNYGHVEGRLPSKVGANHRCGYVSLIGAPNMGKSTLMNAIIDEELSAATRRPQTTRHAILGIMTNDDCQLCMVDTPGVIEDPAYKLQSGMMEAVKGAFFDSDALLLVTDVFSTPIPDDDLFQKVRLSKKPKFVAINKIDLLDVVEIDTREDEDGEPISVEGAVRKWRTLLPDAECIIPLVASEGPSDKGVFALRKVLMGGPDAPASLRDLGRPIPGMFRAGVKTITDEEAANFLPLGPPLYDQDALTDRSERFFCSEFIRASLFEQLKKELPYCCEVQINSFRDPRDTDKKRLVRISATIYVERESQKQILIGTGGQTIKSVGQRSREKLEKFLQDQVFLSLDVKVDKNWRNSDEKLKQYGYI